MRSHGLFLILAAASLLLASLPADGQDNTPKRFFGGERGDRQGFFRRGWASGGPKRVEIDLTNQTLRAYEGNRVVLKSRISSGRNRATPTGSYTAGPYKAETHFSSLYSNAPMPWSVQVHGNIFIHGFSLVPDYPASHGCIRLPVDGNNPARRFYEWVDVGTPIQIYY